MEEGSGMDPLEVTAAMLCEVFPGHPKYRNPAFLDWEYPVSYTHLTLPTICSV